MIACRLECSNQLQPRGVAPVVSRLSVHCGKPKWHRPLPGCEDGRRTLPQAIAGTTGFTASPIANDGKVFLTDQNCRTTVVEAGPEFRIVATSDLGEMCWSSLRSLEIDFSCGRWIISTRSARRASAARLPLAAGADRALGPRSAWRRRTRAAPPESLETRVGRLNLGTDPRC